MFNNKRNRENQKISFESPLIEEAENKDEDLDISSLPNLLSNKVLITEDNEPSNEI